MPGDGGKTFSFGAAPPRSLGTFGVAGLVDERAKIFYCSVFSSRHLGRVSDLIAAELRGLGFDELRLRAVLLFSSFEALRAAGGDGSHMGEPLVIECGLGSDRVAVGVSFAAAEASFGRVASLPEAIARGDTRGDFENLLRSIHAHADRVVLRAQASTRRMEVVALLGIPGKIDLESLETRAPLHVVEIGPRDKSEAPKVKAYVELGDLDYPTLLRETLEDKHAPAPATGEVLTHGCKETDDAIKVRAADLLRTLATGRVKGSQEEDEKFTVTDGGTAQTDDRIVIKGSGPVDEGGGSYRVQSLPSASKKLKDVFDKVKGAWPFGSKKGEAAIEEEEEGVEQALAEGDSLEEPKSAEVAESVESVAIDSDEEAEKAEDKEAVEAAAQDIEDTEDTVIETEIDNQAQDLTDQIENRIDKTLRRVESEALELKNEPSGERAHRWMEELVADLTAEKANLAEASKALNSSIHAKEAEFRAKERTFTQELRRREDMIRQKTHAVNRVKDQLTQASALIDRLKAARNENGGSYKKRYGLVQKMLDSAKEENKELQDKVDELKSQVMNAQLLNSAKRSQPTASDFSALQTKYDRAVRQSEEFKRYNQQLLDKLADSKNQRAGGPQEEMLRKRLEAAMKMVTGHQRDAAQLQDRIEEMQRDQMKLKAELNRVNQVNQELRVRRPGGRGNPPKAA